MVYDVTILGGGPGGYVAAIRAAQLGHRVALVEKSELGGVCLNWGCIPTKALLRSAEVLEMTKNARKFGISIGDISIDFEKIIKRSRQVAKRLSKGVEFLMKKNNITVFSGFGKIISPNELVISRENGDFMTIESRNFVIATGARASEIPDLKPDGKTIITSREAMTLPKSPKKLLIIGGGAIGVEFAYFYNALGTKVTLVEMMEHILPVEDSEISQMLEKSLKKQGIEILTDAKVTNCKITENRAMNTIQIGDDERKIESNHTLVAVGVRGNIENIGLENCGIEIENGWIKTDEMMRTNVENIYAIGDVAGPPALAHLASHQGILAVEHLSGHLVKPILAENIPSCTYCHPQVASVGLTEKQAIESEKSIKIGRFPFRANGRALASGETDGLVKTIFDADTKEILGAHIIGENATEMIATIGLGKTANLTKSDILGTIFAHPTLSEMIAEASGDAFEEAVHL